MQKLSLTKSLLSAIAAIIVIAMFFTAGDRAADALLLQQGASGGEVREVQQKLKQWGYYDGALDGVYGAATAKAVSYFQQQNGLKADGKVGDATFKALGLAKYVGSTQQGGGSSNTAQEAQIRLLAQAILAEAEGEPYVGKVAVGAVLLNRLEHQSFPNTLASVIYQSGALESVANGRINAGVNEECLRAARDAINGWDPSYGALYFWNPSNSTSKWIWSRQVLVSYGKHNFGI